MTRNDCESIIALLGCLPDRVKIANTDELLRLVKILENEAKKEET